MPRRYTRPLLEDMRAYAEEAREIPGDRASDDLALDRIRLLAVTPAAEVIGEVAARIPKAIQDALPDIDFASAVAMRNRLIHGYGSVSATILADTIRNDFPPLVTALASALDGTPPDDEG